MIPIITGVIASSIATSSAYAYSGSLFCNVSVPTTLYSSSGVLIIGSVLYTDASLSTPFTGDVFVDGSSNVYYVGGANGIISDIYTCFSSYEGFTDCTQTTSYGTVYVEGGAYYITGTLITTDAEGLNPFANQVLVINGYEISTDANGLILTSSPCPT